MKTTLPPKLSGKEAQFFLQVRVDAISASNQCFHEDLQQQIKFVKLQWWGMSFVEKLTIGSETANYDVVCSLDNFRDYLKDAGRLYVEALSADEETIGFAVIERLERIVDYGGISADEAQVFNKEGQIRGNLRCIFMLEEVSRESDGGITKRVHFDDIEDNRGADQHDQHDYDDVAPDDQESSPKGSPIQTSTAGYKTNLPSWNLSTERLKYLSRVKSFSVYVKQATLNPAVVQHLDTFSTSKPSRSKPSFLIKYELPSESNSVTMCASKQTMARASRTGRGDNVLQFEGRSEHTLRFNTQVLDIWWISKLSLQLFVRHLGQRMPVLMGDSSIGLKHLLINSKYSDSEMKLPIYASTRLQKHLEKHYPEEIIGDIVLSFNFKCNEQQNIAKAEIKSKTKTKPLLESKPAEKQQPTLVSFESPMKSPPLLLLCLLKVNRGRGFPQGSRLYLACRFFSAVEKVSSSIQFSTDTRFEFQFQHVTKMPPKMECKENHLVIEVWNFMEPNSELVGVATVPLHQLYTAFQDPVLNETHLRAELPFVAFNDWFSVRDVLDHGKIKGEIKVLLACGLGRQIYNLTMGNEEEEEEERVEENVEEAKPRSNLLEEETVPFKITISQGRNLPLINKEPPVTYVTFDNAQGKTFTSNMSWTTCQPSWNMTEEVHLPVQMLQDKRHQLIVKVWHHRQSKDYDYVLGFAAIDVSLILHESFTEVTGWYNILDYITRCRGQIKVHLCPLDVQSLHQRVRPVKESSDSVNQHEQKFVTDTSEKANEEEIALKPKQFWNPPAISPDLGDCKSTLHLRLKELDCIAKRLQTKACLEISSNLAKEEKDDQELEKLRQRLESQLEIMQNIVNQSTANEIDKEEDNDDDATYDISEASRDDMRPRMAPDGGNPTEPDNPTRDRPTRS